MQVQRGRFHQAEVKFLDTMNTSYYANSTGTFLLLNVLLTVPVSQSELVVT